MLDRRTKGESQELKLTLLQKRRIPETYAWQNLLHSRYWRREEPQTETTPPHRWEAFSMPFLQVKLYLIGREDVYLLKCMTREPGIGARLSIFFWRNSTEVPHEERASQRSSGGSEGWVCDIEVGTCASSFFCA